MNVFVAPLTKSNFERIIAALNPEIVRAKQRR
jgi:hypothetical protein